MVRVTRSFILFGVATVQPSPNIAFVLTINDNMRHFRFFARMDRLCTYRRAGFVGKRARYHYIQGTPYGTKQAESRLKTPLMTSAVAELV